MLYNIPMKNTDNDAEITERTFHVYDPDNPPFIKLCICDIIRELPELTDEDAARHRDD